VAVTVVEVRPMGPEDAAGVLDLARTLGDWFNEQGLEEMARDLMSHPGYLAVRGGRVLGFVTWNAVDGETANLSWMGVAEPHHRSGIGRTLVDVLVTDLRHRGYRFLDVSTVADSLDYEPYVRTRAFYRAMGFRDHRIDPRFFGSGDDRYDRLLMRLDLRKA
jgi:ribosomal protein S18 acetylase RimI-like enzyme